MKYRIKETQVKYLDGTVASRYVIQKSFLGLIWFGSYFHVYNHIGKYRVKRDSYTSPRSIFLKKDEVNEVFNFLKSNRKSKIDVGFTKDGIIYVDLDSRNDQYYFRFGPTPEEIRGSIVDQYTPIETKTIYHNEL